MSHSHGFTAGTGLPLNLAADEEAPSARPPIEVAKDVVVVPGVVEVDVPAVVLESDADLPPLSVGAQVAGPAIEARTGQLKLT
jgi:hypothetical protein